MEWSEKWLHPSISTKRSRRNGWSSRTTVCPRSINAINHRTHTHCLQASHAPHWRPEVLWGNWVTERWLHASSICSPSHWDINVIIILHPVSWLTALLPSAKGLHLLLLCTHAHTHTRRGSYCSMLSEIKVSNSTFPCWKKITELPFFTPLKIIGF